MAARLLLLPATLAVIAASSPKSPPDPATVAAGAKLYGQYCAPCHGKGGAGDGPAAASLKPRPRNFRDHKQLKSKTDEDLFKVIGKGGPALGLSPVMVGWGGVLKEPQIRQLVAFVRSTIDSAAAGAAAKGRQP